LLTFARPCRRPLRPVFRLLFHLAMKPSKPIEFKGTVASFSALTVTLRSNQLDEIGAALSTQCAGTPDFFSEDIALIDVESLPGQGEQIDWPAVVALLRRYRLNPAAVRKASASAEKAIRSAGLTLAEDVEVAARKAVPSERTDTPPTANAAPAATAAPATVQTQLDLAARAPAAKASTPEKTKGPAPHPQPAVVLDRPLRSGQQLYARNADLVVLAMVNPGAEVMADGNIHVYAPLRGRALAGASGDTQARILTTCFEAELVSIGGVYRPLEPGMPKEVSGKPAQVRLATDEKTGKQNLLIEALKIS
jgi:septum site-determining protein MinC